MTREEAREYLINISYQIGTIGIEYLTCRDGDKMRQAIEVLALEEPHWIPCSKRLPEVDETVMVTTAWGDVTIAERIYRFINDINNICWFIHDGNTNATFDDVVSWMPLPEPYRKEGDQDGN